LSWSTKAVNSDGKYKRKLTPVDVFCESPTVSDLGDLVSQLLQPSNPVRPLLERSSILQLVRARWRGQSTDRIELEIKVVYERSGCLQLWNALLLHIFEAFEDHPKNDYDFLLNGPCSIVLDYVDRLVHYILRYLLPNSSRSE